MSEALADMRHAIARHVAIARHIPIAHRAHVRGDVLPCRLLPRRPRFSHAPNFTKEKQKRELDKVIFMKF